MVKVCCVCCEGSIGHTWTPRVRPGASRRELNTNLSKKIKKKESKEDLRKHIWNSFYVIIAYGTPNLVAFESAFGRRDARD
jgi:hypothetical protein